MPSTSGFGVQVMPQIQFADGAQLAGRGPGEAIAGFNSGIGAINAIQNTRQKALLAPIEQQEAQARLAQIVGSNDFNQQLRPYQLADARYQAAKTQIPIKDQTGFELIKVPQMNADGTPSVDEQGNPVYNVMKRATGNEINAATGVSSPFQEITGVQTPADTLALHASLAEKNRLLGEYQGQNLTIRQQLADVAAQRAQTDSAFKDAKIQHYNDLKATGKYEFRQGIDPTTGQLVLVAINKANPADQRNLTTGLNPIQKQDFLTTIKKMQDDAKDTAPTPPPAASNPFSNAVNNVKNFFTPSAPVDVAPAALPNVAPSTQPTPEYAPTTESDINAFLGNNGLPVAPVSQTPISPYKIRVVKP